MKKTVAAVTAWAVLCAAMPAVARQAVKPAQAAAPSPGCAALADQIEKAQMSIALDKAIAENDDSAPRAQVRATKEVAKLLTIQIALTQLASLKCPAYTAPISDARYAENASYCAMALLSPTNKTNKNPMSCHTVDWKPAF